MNRTDRLIRSLRLRERFYQPGVISEDDTDYVSQEAADALEAQKAEIDRLRAAGLEFMEAAEAVFDWMNGNDLSADHEEQHPDDFKRVSKALVAFRAALSETSNGKD